MDFFVAKKITNHIFLGGKVNYLISYDIENTKNRTKLFENLKDLGLISIQKSVFYGKLQKSEKTIIKKLFEKYCSQNDKAIMVAVNIDINDTYGYCEDEFIMKEFEIL